jgi:hypothetical protein
LSTGDEESAIIEDEEESESKARSKLEIIPDPETLIEIKGHIETHEKITSSVQADAEEKRTTLTALKENVLTWRQHQYVILGFIFTRRSMGKFPAVRFG